MQDNGRRHQHKCQGRNQRAIFDPQCGQAFTEQAGDSDQSPAVRIRNP